MFNYLFCSLLVGCVTSVFLFNLLDAGAFRCISLGELLREHFGLVCACAFRRTFVSGLPHVFFGLLKSNGFRCISLGKLPRDLCMFGIVQGLFSLVLV